MQNNEQHHRESAQGGAEQNGRERHETANPWTYTKPEASASQNGPIPDYLWVRLSLEYGENTPDIAGSKVVYSSDSSDDADPETADVASAIIDLIRRAKQLHEDKEHRIDPREVDDVAASLAHDDLTVEELNQMWQDTPAPQDPDNSEENGEHYSAPQHDHAGSPEEIFDVTFSDVEDENLHRRRMLARAASDHDVIQALIELTRERPELIAYEMGEREVQIYVLCSLNPAGYLNVLHVAHGQIRKGEPLEEYVEWLLERMPVTGIALEEEPGMWVPVPHDVYQIEFLVDGDAAALLDINLDALTSMLLTQPERQIVAAPAGTWTIISGDPHDILAVIAEAKCHALIAEGNAHQQHLIFMEAPQELEHNENAPAWMLGEPEEKDSTILEFFWQSVPKTLTRTMTREHCDSYEGSLEDILTSLPGLPPEPFGLDQDELTRSIVELSLLFGVPSGTSAGRRLESYLRDTKNTLALESVLQLLHVPVELAAVPTEGLEIGAIGTARVFGEDPAELLAAPHDESSSQADMDPAQSDDNSLSAHYQSDKLPDIEALKRSYRLVATNRRVTLAEWLAASQSGEIPYEYTHVGTTKQRDNQQKESLVKKPSSSPRVDAYSPSGASGKAVVETNSSTHTVQPAHSESPGETSAGKDPKNRLLTRVFRVDGTAQLGLATVFWTVARRKKAQGKSAPILTALSTVLAAGGTSEILLAPRLARLAGEKLDEHRSKEASDAPVNAELVRRGDNPQGASSEGLHRRTLVDDLRDGIYVEAPSKSRKARSQTASSMSDTSSATELGERVRRTVRKFFS